MSRERTNGGSDARSGAPIRSNERSESRMAGIRGEYTREGRAFCLTYWRDAVSEIYVSLIRPAHTGKGSERAPMHDGRRRRRVIITRIITLPLFFSVSSPLRAKPYTRTKHAKPTDMDVRARQDVRSSVWLAGVRRDERSENAAVKPRLRDRRSLLPI